MGGGGREGEQENGRLKGARKLNSVFNRQRKFARVKDGEPRESRKRNYTLFSKQVKRKTTATTKKKRKRGKEKQEVKNQKCNGTAIFGHA